MKFNIGDRVEVTIVGDVMNVDDDFLVLSNDVHLWTKTPDIQFRKVPPRKPVVGDVIDAERLQATSWKRGTVITSRDGTPWLLRHSGRWSSPGVDDASFGVFTWIEPLTVVHLP